MDSLCCYWCIWANRHWSFTYNWFNWTILTISQYFTHNDYRFPCLKFIHTKEHVIICDKIMNWIKAKSSLISYSSWILTSDSLQWLPYDMVQRLKAIVIDESNTTAIVMPQQTYPKSIRLKLKLNTWKMENDFLNWHLVNRYRISKKFDKQKIACRNKVEQTWCKHY